ILTGSVDVGQDDVVRAREGWTERVHQRGRSGEPMRLECDDDAPFQRARGVEHGGNLRRMMSVVVDDEHAVRLAADLEAPLAAAGLPQAARDSIARQTELEANGDGRRRGGETVPP